MVLLIIPKPVLALLHATTHSCEFFLQSDMRTISPSSLFLQAIRSQSIASDGPVTDLSKAGWICKVASPFHRRPRRAVTKNRKRGVDRGTVTINHRTARKISVHAIIVWRHPELRSGPLERGKRHCPGPTPSPSIMVAEGTVEVWRHPFVFTSVPTTIRRWNRADCTAAAVTVYGRPPRNFRPTLTASFSHAIKQGSNLTSDRGGTGVIVMGTNYFWTN